MTFQSTVSDEERQKIVRDLMEKFERNEISYGQMMQSMRKKIPASPTLAMAMAFNVGADRIIGLDANLEDIVAMYGEDWHGKSKDARLNNFISVIFDARQAQEIYRNTRTENSQNEETPEKKLYEMAMNEINEILKASVDDESITLDERVQFEKVCLVFEQDHSERTAENEMQFADSLGLLRNGEADIHLLLHEPARYRELYLARQERGGGEAEHEDASDDESEESPNVY